MIKSKRPLFAVCLFFLALLLPLVTSPFLTNKIRFFDRRLPYSFPAAPENLNDFREFPQKLDLYLQDRLGLRDHLITLDGLVQYGIGAPRGDVLIGKSGRFYRTDLGILDQFRGTDNFEKNNTIKKFVADMETLNEYLAKLGTRLYVTIVPAKLEIYAESDLPGWVNTKFRQSTGLQLFEQALGARLGEQYVSIVDSLRKNRDQLIYTSRGIHWTRVGALTGFIPISTQIKKDFPRFSVAGFDDFHIKRIRKRRDIGTIRKMGLGYVLDNELANVTPVNGSFQRMPDDKNTDKKLVAYQNPDVNNKLNLLVIGDSFIARWRNIIPLYAKETRFIPHRRGNINAKLIEAFMPDIVLLEITSFNLTRGFKLKLVGK